MLGELDACNGHAGRADDYHYHTTFIKFGIGRATYDAAQEIRSGDITRDEGVALVRRYELRSRFRKVLRYRFKIFRKLPALRSSIFFADLIVSA